MAYRVRPLGRLRLEAEGAINAGTGGPYISGPGVLGFPSATLGLPFVVSPSTGGESKTVSPFSDHACNSTDGVIHSLLT